MSSIPVELRGIEIVKHPCEASISFIGEAHR
jgi:hypothetical protein